MHLGNGAYSELLWVWLFRGLGWLSALTCIWFLVDAADIDLKRKSWKKQLNVLAIEWSGM